MSSLAPAEYYSRCADFITRQRVASVGGHKRLGKLVAGAVQKPRVSSFDPHRRTARAYRAIKAALPPGSKIYPPERNAKGQYLLWLTEAEANRLASLRRPRESYSEAVIRLARAHDWGSKSNAWRARGRMSMSRKGGKQSFRENACRGGVRPKARIHRRPNGPSRRREAVILPRLSDAGSWCPPIRQCGATPTRAGTSSSRLRAILRPIHRPNARYYRPPTSLGA